MLKTFKSPDLYVKSPNFAGSFFKIWPGPWAGKLVKRVLLQEQGIRD